MCKFLDCRGVPENYCDRKSDFAELDRVPSNTPLRHATVYGLISKHNNCRFEIQTFIMVTGRLGVEIVNDTGLTCFS